MDTLRRRFQQLDRLQQRHSPLAFGYAVIKRYGEDQAGHQAALLTYYAFLALFPLLLVLATLTQIIATSHPHLQTTIINSVTNNFPILGNQLSAHVHGLHKNGLALLTGLLFVFYGARGVADVFRAGVNHIWHIPKAEQLGFPQSLFKSLVIMMVGGAGFIVASVATGTGCRWWSLAPGLRLLVLAANVLILFGLFTLLFQLSLPRRIGFRDTAVASAAAAAGLVILQIAGGYLLRRELLRLDALYSYFALALGLIFWIYLQAQIIYYATEIAAVKEPATLAAQFQRLTAHRLPVSAKVRP